MKLKEFFYCKFVLFYAVITMAAGFVSINLARHISIPIPREIGREMWEQFAARCSVLVPVLSASTYLIPLLCCAVGSVKILCGDPKTEKFKKAAAGLPRVFSNSGLIAWCYGFLLNCSFYVYLKRTLNVPIFHLVFASAFTHVFAGLIFKTLCFFPLEALNRKFVLPHFYPDGGISSVAQRSGTNQLFMVFYLVLSACPILIASTTFMLSKRFRVIPEDNSLFYFYISMIPVGFWITFMFSRFYSVPLKELSDEAGKISEGDYDSRAVICSNDEMGILGDTFNSMAVSLKEKEAMRDAFGKAVAPQVRDYLMDKNGSLGGEIREVTIMFCDIRGFTSLSENMSADKIVTMLNEYFTAMEKCIARHNGVINKYIGDAVMAIFGAPVADENQASDAFLAALEMRAVLIELNESFEKEGLPHLAFGIGIHTGNVLAGNIGAARRMEYTVIGDAVNTASRIEGLCKEYKKDLLISESAAAKIKRDSPQNGGELVFVDEAAIRGRAQKERLWTA